MQVLKVVLSFVIQISIGNYSLPYWNRKVLLYNNVNLRARNIVLFELKSKAFLP